VHRGLLVDGQVGVMLVHQSVLKVRVLAHIVLLPVEVVVMVGEKGTVGLASPTVSPLEGWWRLATLVRRVGQSVLT
jgi:hypothetical protein